MAHCRASSSLAFGTNTLFQKVSKSPIMVQNPLWYLPFFRILAFHEVSGSVLTAQQNDGIFDGILEGGSSGLRFFVARYRQIVYNILKL